MKKDITNFLIQGILNGKNLIGNHIKKVYPIEYEKIFLRHSFKINPMGNVNLKMNNAIKLKQEEVNRSDLPTYWKKRLNNYVYWEYFRSRNMDEFNLVCDRKLNETLNNYKNRDVLKDYKKNEFLYNLLENSKPVHEKIYQNNLDFVDSDNSIGTAICKSCGKEFNLKLGGQTSLCPICLARKLL